MEKVKLRDDLTPIHLALHPRFLPIVPPSVMTCIDPLTREPSLRYLFLGVHCCFLCNVCTHTTPSPSLLPPSCPSPPRTSSPKHTHPMQGAKLQLRGYFRDEAFTRKVIPKRSLADCVFHDQTHSALQQIVALEKGRKLLYTQWGFEEDECTKQSIVALFSGPVCVCVRVFCQTSVLNRVSQFCLPSIIVIFCYLFLQPEGAVLSLVPFR